MAGLYLHIPFCRSKCAYCDFFSTPRTDLMELYADALLREFELRRSEISEEFRTIYIGGGTPTMLPPEFLERLIGGLRKYIPFEQLNEFTIEANPEDITPDSIAWYRSLGINRISIGIQSFSTGELKSISRLHDASHSLRALESLAESGINYSADLIYGLPDQSLEGWRNNLHTLLAFIPPHFSAYLLSYEPGTKLYARLQKGLVREATEEMAGDMYSLLIEQAAGAGYEHYEVSNFSLPGREAVHNSGYWNYTPYLGLGAAAHSFDGTVRRWNPANIKEYIQVTESGSVAAMTDVEDAENRFNDYIITSLRTSAGFSVSFAEEHFGHTFLERFMRNAEALPVGALYSHAPGYLRIPEVRWLTSDAILRELIL